MMGAPVMVMSTSLVVFVVLLLACLPSVFLAGLFCLPACLLVTCFPTHDIFHSDTMTKRQSGRAAQLSNIQAAKAVANIVRTTLGPRSMLKMILDPMGSIVLTNDGHCILREVDVSHPTAKSMIELSRAQDEQVGDGTTSVIVLAAEVLTCAAEPFLRHADATLLHPTVLVTACNQALAQALVILERQAITIDIHRATTTTTSKSGSSSSTTTSKSGSSSSTKDPSSSRLHQLVQSTLQTKFSTRWQALLVDMAIQAVLTVAQSNDNQKSATTTTTTTTESTFSPPPIPPTLSTIPSIFPEQSIDLKRYAKIEKIPGGEMEDSQVLQGVMFQKDTVHSSMRRRIVHPRILLLDTPLEYKKGESQTNMELSAATINNDNHGGDDHHHHQNNESAAATPPDWNALLKLEEDYVAELCAQIIAHKPDIVITEKGVSDLAQHYLQQANITAFRRLRKTDNNRIARAVGATIVSRPEDIQESDIGTGCGLFEMRYIGKDWFCYLTDCASPKACTIVLRGGSKDVLNEVERNLQDAMQVVRNVVYHPKVVPGGGAIEMALAVGLKRYGLQHITGVQSAPFQAVGDAMEVIPRTLAQNCGVSSVIRVLTQLRAKHAAAYDEWLAATAGGSSSSDVGRCAWGIHGVTGELVDMNEYGIWEPWSVKVQTITTAIESACMILRIDDIVSGTKRSQG